MKYFLFNHTLEELREIFSCDDYFKNSKMINEKNNKIIKYLDEIYVVKPTFRLYFDNIILDNDEFIGNKIYTKWLYMVIKVDKKNYIFQDFFHPIDVGLDELFKKYNYLVL